MTEFQSSEKNKDIYFFDVFIDVFPEVHFLKEEIQFYNRRGKFTLFRSQKVCITYVYSNSGHNVAQSTAQSNTMYEILNKSRDLFSETKQKVSFRIFFLRTNSKHNKLCLLAKRTAFVLNKIHRETS